MSLVNNISNSISQFYTSHLKAHVDAIVNENNPRLQVTYFSIPVVGIVFNVLKELDLHKKYDAAEGQADAVQRRTRILEAKNETTKCAITALAIQGIAFILIAIAGGSGLSLLFAIGLGILAGIHALRLTRNEQSLAALPHSQVTPLIV